MIEKIKIERIDDTFTCSFNINEITYNLNARINFNRKNFKIIIYKKEVENIDFFMLHYDDILYTTTIDITGILNEINRKLNERFISYIHSVVDYFTQKIFGGEIDEVENTEQIYVARINQDFSHTIEKSFLIKDDVENQQIIINADGELEVLIEEERAFLEKLYKDDFKTYFNNKSKMIIFSKTTKELNKRINSIIECKIKTLKKEEKFLDIQKQSIENIISQLKSYKI